MFWQSLDGQSQASYWGAACLSRQYHCQHIRSLSAVQKSLRNDFKLFAFFSSYLSVSDTQVSTQVLSGFVSVLVSVCNICLCYCKHVPVFFVCVCMCVLVGRMSIPSVTVAVPSFHAPAAPRESSSLCSLSVLFNERAAHQNAG